MDRKEELKREIEFHQQAINMEMSEMKEKGKRIGKSALVVGGAFLLTYLIVRGVTSGKKKKHVVTDNVQSAPVVTSAAYSPPKKNGITRKLMGLVLTELAVILAGVAKGQIKNYVAKSKNQNDDVA
jgi:hypothetical protein